jgi:hypothetical protein
MSISKNFVPSGIQILSEVPSPFQSVAVICQFWVLVLKENFSGLKVVF